MRTSFCKKADNKLQMKALIKLSPIAVTTEYEVLWVKIRRDNQPFVFTSKTTGPIASLKILSCLIMLALISISIYYRDGMALLAMIMLSASSIMLGLEGRTAPRKIRGKGDMDPVHMTDKVVIRYPKGSFVVVECDGDTSDELFFTHFEVQNFYGTYARNLFCFLGYPVFIGAILALRNSKQVFQLIFASLYILILGMYWIVICLPGEIHWNRSVYRTEVLGRCRHPTFTMALYKCMVVTKSNEWVKRSQAAPSTPAWNAWLDEGMEHTENVRFSNLEPSKGQNWEYDPNANTNADWDPQEALSRAIREQRDGPYN
jgi:hypothetical protein